MPSFKISKRTMTLMKKEFERFQNARKKIHENIINYVADYRQFDGTSKDRKEFLEEEYRTKTPDLNSLIFNDDKKILWHVEDIVIVTGLNQSSISRILSKMSLADNWCAKILPLRIETKSANNVPIYAYREEIFDLIIDYQEARCFERFTKPRRGNPNDIKELKRYWEYLKESSKIQNEILALNNNEEEINEAPDLPPMKINDVLMLIFRKSFTAKILTISPIIFAITFELVRRWNILIYFFAGTSILIFILSVIFLRLRKFKASTLSDVGAVAMLAAIFWGLGLFSEGIIFTPSGMALSLKNDDHQINIVPRKLTRRKAKITFAITSDFYDDIKEIYYRTNPNEPFKLTGFNDFNYPLLFIEPETQHGKLNIELKYKDTQNKEHGPFYFSFDMDEIHRNFEKQPDEIFI